MHTHYRIRRVFEVADHAQRIDRYGPVLPDIAERSREHDVALAARSAMVECITAECEAVIIAAAQLVAFA